MKTDPAEYKNLVSGVNIAEPYIQSPCIFKTNTSSEPTFTLLKAYTQNSLLRNFNTIEGTKNLTPDSVLIGNFLAKDLNVTVGDWVYLGLSTMKHVKIIGITGELVDFSFITTIEEAQDILGFDNAINGFILGIEPGQKQSIRKIIPTPRLRRSNSLSKSFWMRFFPERFRLQPFWCPTLVLTDILPLRVRR